MISIVSPAQRLPVDVLRLIVKYVVNEKKKPFGGISNDKRNLKALLPLCLNWREVALECLWNKAKLKLNAKSTGVYLTRPPWVKDNVLSQNTVNVVRELCIGVNLSGIVHGTARKCLVKYLGDTKWFSSAHKLVVTVNYVRGEIIKNVVIENSTAFADYLKSLAPAARTTEVVCATKSA
ncbi:hypothetical protein H4S04_005633 [Coemansia sp. S16]|nr:hypothetical protein H4S04_005633 [Coemansia sp. S16]